MSVQPTKVILLPIGWLQKLIEIYVNNNMLEFFNLQREIHPIILGFIPHLVCFSGPPHYVC